MEKRTKAYEQYLLGCRFCPMCKPASDSLNATFLECDSTRAHAMIIWRVLNGIKDYTPREAELLYQTNLDGVSEAFCVDHYPVSEIMLAARRDIVEAGKQPVPVEQALNRKQDIRVSGGSDSMLAVAEGMDLNPDAARDMGAELARKLGSGTISGFSGYTPYVLGSTDKAREEAEAFAAAIEGSGAKLIIANGPETLYTLTKLYPQLGIHLSIPVVSLTRRLLEGKAFPAGKLAGKKVFFHDPRAAYYLGDSKPDEKVIMPDFFGPEELLGEGEVYELPRQALREMGADLMFSVWSRAMANALGHDEGVSITYPKLAGKMAARRLQKIRDLGAEYIAADSMAAILYLRSLDKELLGDLKPLFLADLV